MSTSKVPLSLIPQPAQAERGEGQFTLTAQTPLVAVGGNPHAAKAAAQFAAMVKESFGQKLPQLAEATDGAEAAATAGAIGFRFDEGAELPREGYVLEITPSGISICAGDAAGLFYGAVTLWQLLTAASEPALPATLPVLRITDSPRFKWRGLMVDSARHMQSVEQIKRLIDQAARHKLNTFHWHLVDDQGWRLEIKRYPKLTEVGAWRIPAGKAGIGPDGQPLRYGGFYTQAEARDIVAYAAERHITVVPEIEMPGHVQSAIASYPELGCVDKPLGPESLSTTGIHPYLYNVEDSTFAFLENVLLEVFEIFPGRYVHIGGDEAVKFQWKNSPKVQEKIRALGLADENALQSWFIRRIGHFISERGRVLLGWDEILDGGPLPDGATVMVWREMHSATQTAQSGHDVIVCPQSSNYLNRLQSLLPDEPSCRSGLTPLDRVYHFDPIPPGLSAEQRKSIIGLQANVWTEFIPTGPHIEHMLFPRLSAVSEVAWSPEGSRDWQAYLRRLVPHMRRLARSGINVADSAFAVKVDVQAVSGQRARVHLSTQTGFGEIRYTLDGSEPRADSPFYTAPLTLDLPVTLTASSFFEGISLAKPRSTTLNELALRTRIAEQLIPNVENDAGRYQDDEPLEGPRIVVPVNILNPHWVWENAPVDDVYALRAELIDLPYSFSIPAEFPAPLRAEPGDPVFLQVYLDSFEGELVAQAQVNPQQPEPLKILDIRLPKGLREGHNLCFKFTGDPRNTLWAIKRIQLLTAEEVGK